MQPTRHFDRAKRATESRWREVHPGCFAGVTVGALVPPYYIAVTDEDAPSAAALSDGGRAQLFAGLENLRGRLEARMGPSTVMVFEHGAAGGADWGSSCINEHHMHVVGVTSSLVGAVEQAFVEAGGEGRLVRDWAELQAWADSSYQLFSTRPGEYRVFSDGPRFSRQFGRQVLAERLGIGSQYNWRDHPMLQNMRLGTQILDSLLAEEKAA